MNDYRYPNKRSDDRGQRGHDANDKGDAPAPVLVPDESRRRGESERRHKNRRHRERDSKPGHGLRSAAVVDEHEDERSGREPARHGERTCHTETGFRKRMLAPAGPAQRRCPIGLRQRHGCWLGVRRAVVVGARPELDGVQTFVGHTTLFGETQGPLSTPRWTSGRPSGDRSSAMAPPGGGEDGRSISGMSDHPGTSTQRAAASNVSAGVALNAIAASGACRRTRLTTSSNSSG